MDDVNELPLFAAAVAREAVIVPVGNDCSKPARRARRPKLASPENPKPTRAIPSRGPHAKADELVSHPKVITLPVAARSPVTGNISSEPRPSAELVFLPVTRHKRKIDDLVRRLGSYDPKRTAFFLKQELAASARKRIKAGIPPAVAEADNECLRRAVLIRLGHYGRQGGDAA